MHNPVFQLKTVDDRRTEELFLDVPEALFHEDPNWIPCLRKEIRNIFDPETNPYFTHGTARRWILTDTSGKLSGRIAAFVNFNKMYDGNKKVGCIGFFECINSQEAARALFDTAIEWLVELYQTDVIDGPVNFGENDKYWGLLIKGFTPPSYGMNYNPPYYQHLFEMYGFDILYRQITTRIDLRTPLPERVHRIARRVLDNKQYTFRSFRYKDRDRFILDFIEVYNQAWASFKNFQPMEEKVIRKSLEEMKPIMDESAMWFVYSGNAPVGFLLAVPDVNEILKYTNGKLNIWGKCKFLFYKHWKGFSCLRVVIMGIVPQFQQRGLESGLILQAHRGGRTGKRYRYVQLAWVGDFNEKMIAIHVAMGATEDKQHATFRKSLNRKTWDLPKFAEATIVYPKDRNPMSKEIQAFNQSQATEEKAICTLLYKEINKNLSEAASKIWHGHPVWFLESNPVVGYSKQKAGIRLMFWSGVDFDEKDLKPGTGKFKDASIVYTEAGQIDREALKRWLEKARNIQWDYKNVVKRKGKLERIK